MDISKFLSEIYLNSLLPFERNQMRCKFGKDDDILQICKENLSRKIRERSPEKFFEHRFKSNQEEKSICSETINSNVVSTNYDWLSILQEVILDKKPEEKNHLQHLPFIDFFTPFITFFERIMSFNYYNIELNVQKKILRAFYKELFQIASPSLFYELKHKQKYFLKSGHKKENLYQKTISYLTEENFKYIFNKYPILAKKIGVKMSRYIIFINNFLNRLKNDERELLKFLQLDTIKIENIEFNSGDFHNGEATILLTLKGSKKIVYKPRNISITTPYNQLIDWVNLNLDLNLKKFIIIDKTEYGWIQHIENGELLTLDEVKKYYYSAGVLCGITYFLNSRDFHEENVIATQRGPVLIDHEMIFGAKIKDEWNNNKEASIFESMLLPKIKEKHFKNGFGNNKKNDTQDFFIKIIYPNSHRMAQVPQIKKRLKKRKNNIPYYNSKPQNLKDFEEDFINGFTKLYNLFFCKKDFLLSKSSPLLEFKNKAIRHILRPTRVYVKLLKQLNKVDVLECPKKYESTLQQLSRAYIRNENQLNLLELEISQLICGDIPIFLSNTSIKTIQIKNKKPVEIYENTAIENVLYRVKNSSDTDLNKQLKNIGLSFAEL